MRRRHRPNISVSRLRDGGAGPGNTTRSQGRSDLGEKGGRGTSKAAGVETQDAATIRPAHGSVQCCTDAREMEDTDNGRGDKPQPGPDKVEVATTHQAMKIAEEVTCTSNPQSSELRSLSSSTVEASLSKTTETRPTSSTVLQSAEDSRSEERELAGSLIRNQLLKKPAPKGGPQKGPVTRWRKKIAPSVPTLRTKRGDASSMSERSKDASSTAQRIELRSATVTDAESSALRITVSDSLSESGQGDSTRAEDSHTQFVTERDVQSMIPASQGDGSDPTTATAGGTGTTLRGQSRDGSGQQSSTISESQSNTDPAGIHDGGTSNAQNTIPENAPASDQLPSASGDISGIVRSSLDLLCPPPQENEGGVFPMDSRPVTTREDTPRTEQRREHPCASAPDSQGRSPSATSLGAFDRLADSRTGSSFGALSPANQQAIDSGVGRKMQLRSRTSSQSSEGGQSTDSALLSGDFVDVSDASTRRARNKQRQSASGASEDSLSPLKRAKGNRTKMREAPDRSTMTMQELIYYNPSANPMSSSVEERRRKQQHREGGGVEVQLQGDTQESQPSHERARVGGDEGGGGGGGESGGEEDGERIVPQLKIGPDGKIIIDENSMVVETTKRSLTDGTSEPVYESSGHTTSSSFRKSYRVSKWTKEETSRFFKALSQVGTDFTMMTLLLPKRSRKELKNKFKKEEKNNPHLISQALKSQVSFRRLQQKEP